jgi:hypothetical protein
MARRKKTPFALEQVNYSGQKRQKNKKAVPKNGLR